MNNEDLNFSPEVAETIGLEEAIILSIYKKNLQIGFNNSSEISNYLKKNISFISEIKIENSVDKLIRLKLIEFSDKKNYSLRKPSINLGINTIDENWEPSNEAMDIINMTDISPKFISTKIMEFKVYWTERGQKKNNWNSTFIEYIRREWAKEKNSNKTMPFSIDENWYPDDDVFDILSLSNISKDSALKYLREFILYWKDNGSALTTWNSKFIEHVKRRKSIDSEFNNNEKNKKHTEPGKYTKTFKERSKDDSWAEEINIR